MAMQYGILPTTQDKDNEERVALLDDVDNVQIDLGEKGFVYSPTPLSDKEEEQRARAKKSGLTTKRFLALLVGAVVAGGTVATFGVSFIEKRSIRP